MARSFQVSKLNIAVDKNMQEVTKSEKRTLGQKLLEFQKSGLESYGKYLEEQLAQASNSEFKNAYKNYIQEQMGINTKNIAEIEEKLKDL
jgi:hypothetical protein